MTDEPDRSAGTSPEPDAEKRGAPRRRTLKQGVAAFHDQYSDLECIVRDMSETGARLKFRDPSMVPERFILHVPMDGTQVSCERRWSKGMECGVIFVGPAEPSHLARRQHIAADAPAPATPPFTRPKGEGSKDGSAPAAGEKLGFIEVPPAPKPFGHRGKSR